jgi:hypothetical protein
MVVVFSVSEAFGRAVAYNICGYKSKDGLAADLVFKCEQCDVKLGNE